MYRISYEKCVLCFLFLVVLAVLSCSGFRIDNLAMTDISKRNSQQQASSAEEAFARLFSQPPHRVRHHRQVPEMGAARPHARRRRQDCVEPHVTWKAYRASVVVVARAESMKKSHHQHENYTVLFKVKKRLKNATFPVDDTVLLRFSNGSAAQRCEYYDEPTDVARRSHFLVKAKIEQSKEYLLFLDAYGAHNYSAVFVPELIKNMVPRVVERVLSKSFRPQPPRLDHVKAKELYNTKQLKLVCRVQGLPIPRIYWKRNNTLLHPNSHLRISHKKKKRRERSMLIIRNPKNENPEKYECYTRGLDGREVSGHDAKRSPAKEASSSSPKIDAPSCSGLYEKTFCHNGGTCFNETLMGEISCVCADGYKGPRCDEKESNQSSMYRQTPLSTCKLGLYTKYDNC